MDTPRHPQVIRPWKTGPAEKDMQRVPPTTEPRRERSKEVPSFKRWRTPILFFEHPPVYCEASHARPRVSRPVFAR